MAAAMAAGLPAFAADPVVTNVRGDQRQDNSKLVDIFYDLADPDSATVSVKLEVSADGGATWTVPVASAKQSVGPTVTPGIGKYILWNAEVDWNGQYSDKVRFRITANDSANLVLGLIAYYPFDANTADASGHPGADLSNSGGTISPAGRVGGCFSITPGAYATANVDISQVPCTIGLWVKMNSEVSWGSKILHNFGYGGNGDKIRGLVAYNWNLQPGDEINRFRIVVGETGMPPIGVVTVGQWTHFVLVYSSGTSASAYINGSLAGGFTCSLGTGGQPLCLGKDPGDWWGPFNGCLDELRIYNRALSATEVQQLYNASH
ncbi:MAG: LamG domain-containing protein [Verrucomicrobia bacterium]|nr:LamG domain-containing protein [Verrucomicrobiota bacterium]